MGLYKRVRVAWYGPVIPAIRMWRQKDQEFNTNPGQLGFITWDTALNSHLWLSVLPCNRSSATIMSSTTRLLPEQHYATGAFSFQDWEIRKAQPQVFCHNGRKLTNKHL